MATKMKMKGHWQEAKGEIKETWGELTDDELDQAEGNWDQLVGTIRQKTGQKVEDIEQKLDGIFDSMSEDDSTETSG